MFGNLVIKFYVLWILGIYCVKDFFCEDYILLWKGFVKVIYVVVLLLIISVNKF